MKSFLLLISFALIASICNGFVTPNNRAMVGFGSSETSLGMGLFDGIMKAFQNEEYSAPPEGVKATARHILVKSNDEAIVIMDKIKEGGSFSSLASEYSTCPSKNQGGSLGSFRPGTMVPEFDEVIFNPDTNLNEVVGPVMTPFGYHLIVVEKRTGV